MLSRSGIRRQTGPGRWRNTANTRRNAPGTQIVRRPARSPLTTAAATASGVVAIGAGSRPAVIDEATKPGSHDEHARAAAGERVAEALGERVEAGLRRPVDEVRLADPLTGDARQHDQAPWPCARSRFATASPTLTAPE